MSKLKKLLTACLLSILFSSMYTFADAIGFIQMDKLLLTYKEAQTFQKDLDKMRKSYEKALSKHQEKIEKAREKGKAEDHLKKLVESMEKELKPKQEEIIQFDGQAKQRLIAEIMSATKVVSKDYGIDVVLDKQVVYVGGFDLTDFVIDKLNR